MSEIDNNREFVQASYDDSDGQVFPSEEPTTDFEAIEEIHEPFQFLIKSSNFRSSGILRFYGEKNSWIIYFDQGKILYSALSCQSLEELRFHLRTLGCKEAIEALKAGQAVTIEGEHKLEDMPLDRVINWLNQRGFLNAQQTLQLAQLISKEALEPLFWKQEASYCWEQETSQPIAITIQTPLDISTLKEEFNQNLQKWQNFLDEIESPYQRPYFFNHRASKSASNTLLGKLSKYMRGYSIHQLAKIVKQDDLKLARMLYPSIQNGEICLREPKSPWDSLPKIPRVSKPQTEGQGSSATTVSQKTYKIACVDDSPTILREMQRLLEGDKYEITKIDSPIEAASTLFRVKPDLILMDISMPEINGYKLCSLLRNSNALAGVPIIMATSRTGVIDKVRAKTVGATDYLTKPFTRGSLLTMIEKYLG